MKVLVAPDSFKDALEALEVARCIQRGLRRVNHIGLVDTCPVSDGGEGFAKAIQDVFRDQLYRWTKEVVAAYDPLGRLMHSLWFKFRDIEAGSTAIIELATTAGLELLSAEERDPQITTTIGTGHQICDALDHGVKTIVLGIGGSATNDAGCGIGQALGVKFYDRNGEAILTKITGGDLHKIASIDFDRLHKRAKYTSIRVACDVNNPLTGPNGAAYVYAPQKGATPEQVEELDAGLRHMAKLWRDQLGVDVEQMPGAGAAGGVGGGLVAMLGAELVPGAELVLDTIGFDERIKDADLVVTGEGRLDSQSLQGKAAMTVAKRCQRAGVPCVALVGSVGEGAEEALNHGLSAYHVIGEGLPAEESIRRTGELLEAAAMKLAQDRLMS